MNFNKIYGLKTELKLNNVFACIDKFSFSFAQKFWMLKDIQSLKYVQVFQQEFTIVS